MERVFLKTPEERDRTDAADHADITLQSTIRQMLQTEYGFDDSNTTYHSLVRLTQTVSRSSFQKYDLLRTLVTMFKGDVASAIKFAYPNVTQKPPLTLNEVHHGDSFQEYWRLREAEILSRILSTMVNRRPVYNYFFKDRKTGKRGGHTIKRGANEQHMEKKYVESWLILQKPCTKEKFRELPLKTTWNSGRKSNKLSEKPTIKMPSNNFEQQ